MAQAEQVRLLIPDTGTPQIFSDSQIGEFLVLASADYTSLAAQTFAATAMALRSIAGNQAMVRGKSSIQDVSVDGVAEAGELRRMAGEYERKAQAAQTKADAAAKNKLFFGVIT